MISVEDLGYHGYIQCDSCGCLSHAYTVQTTKDTETTRLPVGFTLCIVCLRILAEKASETINALETHTPG